MATYVLVHGGWHGGWCYARVARALRKEGHDVFTPTLTGLGERSHLSGMHINLSTHIQDVINVIEFEDLSDVILCGHSYGGMVTTGVAGQIGERIRTLFYLDAFVPEDGQALWDLIDPAWHVAFMQSAKRLGGRLAPIPAAVFGVNPADAAEVDRKCVPHPADCYTEALSIGDQLLRVRNRTYVFATRFDASPYRPFYERLRMDPSWYVATIDCAHDVMLDDAPGLTRFLLAETAR